MNHHHDLCCCWQALHTLDVAGSDSDSLPSDVISRHVTPTPFSALLAEQSRSAVTPGQARSQPEVTPGLQRVLEVSKGGIEAQGGCTDLVSFSGEVDFCLFILS